jgi:hypothetical protein
MRYSDEELRRMKASRRELVTEYGNKGQHHPMGRMIGGLNPAAQELHVLRGKIAEAESERRGPSPVLTPRPGSKGGYGLKFDIEHQGHRGKLGTDNFGRWYVIIGEGSEANVIASDFKTKSEAAKAFVRLSGATREGATRHHATKKSSAQLQREIDEVLGGWEEDPFGGYRFIMTSDDVRFDTASVDPTYYRDPKWRQHWEFDLKREIEKFKAGKPTKLYKMSATHYRLPGAV